MTNTEVVCHIMPMINIRGFHSTNLMFLILNGFFILNERPKMNKTIFQCDFRSDLITFYESYNYKKDYLGIVPKLHCQSCNREIPYDEKYVKDNLLYVTSDWTKCLCSRYTTNWKRCKEIAEAYPNFGKRVDFKMVCVDEL